MAERIKRGRGWCERPKQKRAPMNTPSPVPQVDELLPCPFCGSTNIDPKGWMSADRSGPACDDCEGSCDTVERWNNRKSPASPSPDAGVIAEIGKRHEHDDRELQPLYRALAGLPRNVMHDDRATLLRILKSRTEQAGGGE